MEDYFAAKRCLFTEQDTAVSVVNLDDPFGRCLAGELSGPVTFALDRPAAYRATALQTGLTGSRFTVETPDSELALSSPLTGRFNVSNVLGALAVARSL